MKARWLRPVMRLGVAASFALIGWFLWRHLDDLRAVNWRALAWPVTWALVLYGLALGVQGGVWLHLFSRLTATPWRMSDVRTYINTHLMRRLPGAPWYMAGRAMAYAERGAEATRAALAVSLLEWGGIVLSGLPWILWGRAGWGGALGAMAALLVLVAELRRWRWPARWVPLARFSLKDLYGALLGYTVQWLLAAWMLYGLLGTLVPERAPTFMVTGSLWAISGVVSSLAVFAPAGLGVRELSLVALLAPRIGAGYAALAALLMRILFTVGDLVWGLLALAGPRDANTP